MSEYKPSFYSETRKESLIQNTFESGQRVDVCIVGGGIASISCAQKLLEAGFKVTILEACKIFSGASGLNGGLSSIEKKVGFSATKTLHDITIAGMERISQNITNYKIESASKKQGKVVLLRYKPSRNEQQQAEILNKKFNYKISPVDKTWLQETLSSNAYGYGFLHKQGFHIHPLNYGVALARNLQHQGLEIHEGEHVESMKLHGDSYEINSTSGKIIASHVVICTGGYASGEERRVEKAILPITTYVAVSEPDEALRSYHIKTDYGFGDTRRASDYYRIVNGNQLLWGGRITAFPTNNIEKIKRYIKHDILKTYPKIADLRIKTAWSGKMGYSIHKMPHIGKLDEGLWYCTAFGGRGLGAGTAGGQVVAEAIMGDTRKIELFIPFGLRNVFGFLGKLGVEFTYKKYQISDRLKEFRYHID